MTVQSEIRKAWEYNVAFNGSPLSWWQTGQALELVAGYSVPRDIDLAIANALGVGVRMVTIRQVDAAGRVPRTLDRLDIAGEALTVDVVTPVVQSGELFGWRCYCAGSRPGP
jgi:hypothetical protein